MALAVIVALSHASMRGLITMYVTVPLGMIGFGLGAWAARSLPPKPRVRAVLLGAVLAMSLTLLWQSYGITGAYAFELHARWSSAPGSWLRGPKLRRPRRRARARRSRRRSPPRNGPVSGERIAWGTRKAPTLATDWQANPPKLLWKKPVGAGWSSFAVAGPFAFTQEQRGPNEVVVCYEVATGNEVWTQQREARFDEPMGGPGPRATPTLAEGAVFVTSATGVLLRLKAGTGEVVWQQDFKALSGRAAAPMWGFAASPLVTGSLVIVYAGGTGDKGVMAFDAASGEPKWSVACGPESYSSPQLSKVLGEETVLMLTNDGLLLLDPATGKVRLNYEWKFQGYRALQPTVIGEDVILLPTPMSEGTRAIRVSKSGDQLAAAELWTSKQLKTDFSDLLAYKGYVYGNDGSMLSCLDLKTGARTWKGGRYGKGQALLLDSAGQILIAAEDGRVVLLQADPAAHKEITSFQALQGKTWNHPVLVGDKLLVRNATEAACYVLPLAPAR